MLQARKAAAAAGMWRNIAAASAIAGRRFMSPVAKSGDRAAVHGVRAPLPSVFASEHTDEEKGEDLPKQARKDTGEERPEEGEERPGETKRTAEASVVPKADLSPSSGSTPKAGGQFLHHNEIPVPNPNFQPSRRLSVLGSSTKQDRVHVSGGKQTKVSGEQLEDVEEKFKEEESSSSTPLTASGQPDAFEERARESLEQVRSGVPSTQASGVMTNFVTRIAYFQEPEEAEVEWGTAEEVLEKGRRQWEEAAAAGDGQNPASKLLRERLEHT